MAAFIFPPEGSVDSSSETDVLEGRDGKMRSYWFSDGNRGCPGDDAVRFFEFVEMSWRVGK